MQLKLLVRGYRLEVIMQLKLQVRGYYAAKAAG